MVEKSSVCERLGQISRSLRAILRCLNGGRDSQDSSPKASPVLCEILDLLCQTREQVSWAEEKWVVKQPRLDDLHRLLHSFETCIRSIELYFQPGGVGVRYFRKQLLEQTFIPRLEQYRTLLLVAMQPDSCEKTRTEKQLWRTMSGGCDLEPVSPALSYEYEEHLHNIAHDICSKNFITLADLSNKRQQGTCQWIFENEKYSTWLSGCTRTLYCIGPPGAGKTFLCSSVIGNLRKTFTSPDIAVVFIFGHDETEEDQVSITILANVLAQLVYRRRSVTNATSSLYRSKPFDNGRASAKAYQNAIRAETDRFSKVFFVIDGLDMISDKDRILNRLQKLSDHAQFLVTLRESRHGQKGDSILVQTPKEDLKSYVDSRINQDPGLAAVLGQYPKEYGLREAFIHQVVGKSHGLFLLAKLHMNLLSRCNDVSILERTLVHLPETLTDAYGESMKQVVSRNLHASRCIFWTLYAYRPLTVSELKCAATFEPQNGAAQKELDSIEHVLLVETAGLLTVDPMTETVRLIHNTAKEYLSGAVARVFFPTARKHIAETCLTVITSDDVVDDCYISDGTATRNSNGSLLDYASTHWGHHAREAPEDEQTPQVLIRAFLDKLCWRRPPTGDNYVAPAGIPNRLGLGKYFADWTALHVLAYFGVIEKAKRLLEMGDNVNSNDNCLEITPLHCAAHRGNEEMVELLLDHNAEINAACKDGNTALHVAAEKGQRKVVKLLLSRWINPKMANRDGATALQLAIETANDEATVPLLAKRRADMDIQNEITGNTALHLAVESKKPRILLLLLEKGAALNIANKQGLIPLQLAAKLDNCEGLTLILDHGMQVEARSLFGLTALHIAALAKNWIAFDLLFIAGADVNAWNNDGESLLHEQARTASNSSVPAHLLEKGANIEARTSQGYTPLQCAAMNSNKDMFFFLLRRGAKVLVETSKGESLLHITPPFSGDSLDILRVALEAGLDTDAAASNGWTPLHQTIFAGTGANDTSSDKTLAYIDLLLSHGADINATSSSAAGETPLHLAIIAIIPRPDLVLFLAKCGASVDCVTRQGKTPLHLAAERGRESMFHALVEAGANTSSIKSPTLSEIANHEFGSWSATQGLTKQHPFDIFWFDESEILQLPREKDQRESVATTIEEVEVIDTTSETDGGDACSTPFSEDEVHWLPIMAN